MKETRTLDRLAVIGLILSLALMAIFAYTMIQGMNSISSDASWTRYREAVFHRMPDSEIRADYEVLTAWQYELYPEVYPQRNEILAEALRRYPNSARLHLRAGMVSEEDAGVEALAQAAELDPDNSLPLYLLAADAARRESFDEALSLIRRGNERGHATYYPFSYDDVPAVGIAGLTTVPVYTETMQTSARLRRLARYVSERASEAHAAGRTDEALTMLDNAKGMANAVMHTEEGVTIDLLMGTAFIRILHNEEKEIYADTDSEAGLSRISQEEERLDYVRAGVHMHTEQTMDAVMHSTARFFAPIVIVIALLSQIFAIVGTWLEYLHFARAAKKAPASEMHLEATRRTFPVKKLLKLYPVILLPMGVALSVLAYLTYSHGYFNILPVILWSAGMAPVMLLIWLAERSYKRAYREVAAETGTEIPDKLWKGAPVQERREAARRIAGVHGGAAAFLVVIGLVIAMGMKLTMGAFPWQFEYVMVDMHNREKAYVKALLAGEVDVPKEKIREIEKKDQKRINKAADTPTP